ncbi:hypothetical protein E2N92_00735 [Methanofollis formosanus]|uniref:Uncharacterized protein n=1 Tax=Methanofollis formosanus TaxID=299308 RepID=A0A8G1EEB7_9EURY|nr:hypothetical protein [Methanofollis formosanus]QYZ78058.1 hypothetical protein E2N92_00735 [Methanofollis formosanus]
MRKSARLVTFSKVVETAFYVVQEQETSYSQLQEHLGVSMDRSKEILREMARMDLILQNEDHFKKTATTIKFVQAIREDDWRTVHQIMMGYPHYATFYYGVRKYGPIELNNLPNLISDEYFNFNSATLQYISDLTLRVGTIQQNVFNNHYYAIDDTNESFTVALLNIYDELNRSGVGNLKQRYVEIPKIREHVCEKLKIQRETFDKKFLDLYVKNIGRLELSGAPITTHAKKSDKKIKSVNFSEMPDRITMELTSDQYLNGIECGRRQYYYLAIHKRDLS